MRRIVRGAADDSYGIEVAKLAGIPDIVINRAKQVLSSLESGEIKVELHKSKVHDEGREGTLADIAAANLVKDISRIDVETLTPIESMTKLFDIVNKAKKMNM